jgi:hypothetical protein
VCAVKGMSKLYLGISMNKNDLISFIYE